MKKRLFISAALLLVSGVLAMAQISTGEPSAVKIKTGNRPDKGTFGIFMGSGMDFGSFINSDGSDDYVLPLVNIKYFFTDKLEGRIGLDIYRHDVNLSGKKYKAVTVPPADDAESAKFVNNEGSGNAMLWPGIAYHFTKHNILDVYCGAELPLGLTSASSKSVSGDPSVIVKSSSCAFNIGLGAFIGLQAFVGNLPLAIGVEYGLYGAYAFGLKTKHVRTDENSKKVWYTNNMLMYDPDTGNPIPSSVTDPFEKLHVGEGYMGNQLRFTISYYFK